MTMTRHGSMMLYAFGGPMDGLIVRMQTEDGLPTVSRVGVGRKFEYEVRELTAQDGTHAIAFVHRLLTTDEAVRRYQDISGRSRRN